MCFKSCDLGLWYSPWHHRITVVFETLVWPIRSVLEITGSRLKLLQGFRRAIGRGSYLDKCFDDGLTQVHVSHAKSIQDTSIRNKAVNIEAWRENARDSDTCRGCLSLFDTWSSCKGHPDWGASPNGALHAILELRATLKPIDISPASPPVSWAFLFGSGPWVPALIVTKPLTRSATWAHTLRVTLLSNS